MNDLLESLLSVLASDVATWPLWVKAVSLVYGVYLATRGNLVVLRDVGHLLVLGGRGLTAVLRSAATWLRSPSKSSKLATALAELSENQAKLAQQMTTLLSPAPAEAARARQVVIPGSKGELSVPAAHLSSRPS